MVNIRNPFKLRASEQINNTSQFLHLFDSHVLNIINSDWFIEKVHYINSSPGAGKSSLLRVFSPEVLLELHKTGRINPEYKDIFSKLKQLGVISYNGPELLGIEISCSGNLKSIRDCSFNQKIEKRIFFTLLTSRLILSMLHGVMILKELSSVDELCDLKIDSSISNPKYFLSESIPDNGRDLFFWADNIEKVACEMIDSLEIISDQSKKIPDISNFLFLLNAACLKFNNETFVKKSLIMFDDFHELPPTQRMDVKKYLYSIKFPLCFWIAQRLEGITPKEVFSVNSHPGAGSEREYDNVFLDDEWKKRHIGYIVAYENILSNIADKRVNISQFKEIHSFRDCLQDSLKDKKYEDIVVDISQRINLKVQSSKKYNRWIEEIQKINENNESFQQKAIAWRSLEILITRSEKKGQLTLDYEFLDIEQKFEKDVDSLKNYAEFFLTKEYSLPYYYGFSKLAKISSSNFEQYLSFSADLFEEAISKSAITKNSYHLEPKRQELIIKTVADKKWHEIPKRIPNGVEIQYFIDKFCQFAVEETNNPSASYPPGITGFSITDQEYDVLMKSIASKNNFDYSNLGYIIYVCLSNNLLQMTSNIPSGGKKEHKFYLNRWICVKYGLPLGYGGWRRKKIKELARWVNTHKPLIGQERKLYGEYL